MLRLAWSNTSKETLLFYTLIEDWVEAEESTKRNTNRLQNMPLFAYCWQKEAGEEEDFSSS
jgi:hypothetical protein